MTILTGKSPAKTAFLKLSWSSPPMYRYLARPRLEKLYAYQIMVADITVILHQRNSIVKVPCVQPNVLVTARYTYYSNYSVAGLLEPVGRVLYKGKKGHSTMLYEKCTIRYVFVHRRLGKFFFYF